MQTKDMTEEKAGLSGKRSRDKLFFANYVHEAYALRQFVKFAWFGLDRATDHVETERKVYDALVKHTGMSKELIPGLLPSEGIQEFAKAQKEDEFSYLHQLASVRLWSILGAYVDDFVLHVLSRTPLNVLPESVQSGKGPVIELLTSTPRDVREFLLDELKQQTKSRQKLGVGRFECLLESLGYGGEVDNEVRRNLLELSELRNAIVHQVGLADQRLTERCPWLGLKVADQVKITGRDFDRLCLAVDWYAYEVLARGIAREDADPEENAKNIRKLNEHKGKMHSEMMHMKTADGTLDSRADSKAE
jgi:hypothetical protein